MLNSPLLWWHNWRYLTHLKDEALSPMGYLVEHLSVANPDELTKATTVMTARKLRGLTIQTHERRETLLGWTRAEHGIEKPSQRLADPLNLSADAFVAEIRKARGARRPLSAAAVKAIRDEWERTIRPAQALLGEAERLERELSDLVNAAYGLTREEVKLLWDTAPPRMPPGRPLWLDTGSS
jgi:hypothetical protein